MNSPDDLQWPLLLLVEDKQTAWGCGDVAESRKQLASLVSKLSHGHVKDTGGSLGELVMNLGVHLGPEKLLSLRSVVEALREAEGSPPETLMASVLIRWAENMEVLRLGELLGRLGKTAGKGYYWQFSENPKWLMFKRIEYTHWERAETAKGGGGVMVW